MCVDDHAWQKPETAKFILERLAKIKEATVRESIREDNGDAEVALWTANVHVIPR
jgi:hypothetical protein